MNAAQVSISLDDAVDLLSGKQDVVEELLGDLSAAQNAELGRVRPGDGLAGKGELYADEGHARVDEHALAQLARDA